MKKTFKRYIPYIKEYKFEYFLVLIGIILTVGATIATAEIMKYVMDDMLIAKKENMLTLIPLSIIFIYFLKSIGRYIQSVFMDYVGQHIMTRFREILLDKIINLDMGFLYLNRSGELISRVISDINQIKYIVSNLLPEFFLQVVTIIGVEGYIVYLNPSFIFYLVIWIPIVIYPLTLIVKKLNKYSYKSKKNNSDIITSLTEVFNNSEVIKANATEKFEMKRFSKKNWELFQINIKSAYLREVVSPVMEIIGAIGLSTVMFFGAHEVYSNSITPGEFIALLLAVSQMFQSLRQIGSLYSKMQESLAASERIFEILDIVNPIPNGKTLLQEDIKTIEFKNVKLRYEGAYALDDINLTITQGQNIALVGDSGGGKSTFINMLLRFYDADEGVIRINNRDIQEYENASLKHHISLVSQRIYIFQDTLAANVAYGQEIDEQKVHEALALADAKEFVGTLKDGIETMMDEFGANLSGGQRQRVAIARAIYKHSSLILFDEATSALDNESEKRIQTSLNSYTKDKITITIAHRLSTIEHADKILVMQHGAIVASGTHQELLENSKVYQRLAGELEA